MTVTREDIERAEGDVRTADVTLTSHNAELVALEFTLAGTPVDDVSTRLDLLSDIQRKRTDITAAQTALNEARTKLANLKAQFNGQQTQTTGETVMPPKPTPAPAATGMRSSPVSVPSSTTNTDQVPSAASQPTTAATANASPQSELESESAELASDKTRYNLAKTWDEEAVINQLLAGDYFQPNLTNQYNNLAYHWRLFAMPDTEFLYEGGGEVSDIHELYARLDSYTQITICETGVTGFNISEVIMESVYSQNAKVNNITMKVNEPNGVQFLDALKLAAREAGVRNYMDFFYYLELTFKGYDNDGEIVLNPFSDLPNGGRWIWTVKINDIDVTLGTGGGQYRLSMLNKDSTALASEYGITIDTIQAKGETIGEFFDDLARSMNNAWAERLRKRGIITHEFKFHGIPPATEKREFVQADENISAAEAGRANAVTRALNGGIDAAAIEAIKLSPKKGDWNNIRTRGSDFAIVDPRNADNLVVGGERTRETKPTANMGRGHRIENIVTEIFSACETAQCMAKDSWEDAAFGPDSSLHVINDKNFRECVTWKVIPEVQYKQSGGGKVVYHYLSNRYGRHIVWHIYPHIDQEPIISRKQITAAFDDATSERFQKGSVAALAVRGLLSKRYDYLFTGVNTEILNLDLNFNMAWQVLLPRLQNYYSDQPLTHALYNKDRNSAWNDSLAQLDAADDAFDQQWEEFEEARINYNKTFSGKEATDESKEARRQLEERRRALEILRQERRAAVGVVDQDSAEIEAEMRERFGDIHAPDQSYTRDYAEYVADIESAGGSQRVGSLSDLPLVPFSYAGADQAKQEAGFGATGQWHAGRSLYGTILNQSSDPAVQKFITIEMTIRGDPYWVGEGSYEVAIAHNNDTRTAQFSDERIGPNHIILRFKYPTDVDASGNVMVKDNETVTGIYKITQIKSKFTGGQFTQEIQGRRLPLIELYSVLKGIPIGNETDQQPTILSAQQRRDQAAAVVRSQDIVAEQARVNAAEARARAANQEIMNNRGLGPGGSIRGG